MKTGRGGGREEKAFDREGRRERRKGRREKQVNKFERGQGGRCIVRWKAKSGVLSRAMGTFFSIAFSKVGAYTRRAILG
jgi:hypothetical protein